PEKFRLPPNFLLSSGERTRRGVLRPSQGEKFLKGPIPWRWLRRAAQAQGQAVHVSLVVWFFVGIEKTNTIKLSSKALAELGVSRWAAQRALRALEKLGLVTVVRQRGRQPRVTLLNPSLSH